MNKIAAPRGDLRDHVSHTCTCVHVCECACARVRVCACARMRDKSIKSSYKHLVVAFI